MSDADVSSQNPIQGSEFIQPLNGTQSMPSADISSTPKGLSSVSTLQNSTLEQIFNSLDASVPMIAAPLLSQFFDDKGVADAGKLDAITAGQLMRLHESEVIIAMLDKWSENIQKEMEEWRKRQKDPDALRRIDERKALPPVLEALSHSARTEGAITPAFLSLMTVGLIFAGTGGVSEAMMINNVSLVGVKPSADQAPSVNIYISDMRAELGLLGAALLQGACYFANTQAVLGPKGKATEPEETAKNYADLMVALVASGEITTMVSALFAQKAAKGEPVNKTLATNLELQIKILLLSTALAGLYRSEKEGGTGGLTAAEFQGLLDGSVETFGPYKEQMDKLIGYINNFFADPALSEKSAASLKAALLAFLDQSPTLATLTNPAKVFAGILPQVNRGADDLPA